MAKHNSITRRWRDNRGLLGQISLVMIDEVHLLNEDRGATLEAIVSRMKTMKHAESLRGSHSSRLRIIAVSATIPNVRGFVDRVCFSPGAAMQQLTDCSVYQIWQCGFKCQSIASSGECVFARHHIRLQL